VSLNLRTPLDEPALQAAFGAGLERAAISCEAMSGGRLRVTSAEARRLTTTEVLVSAGGAEVAVAAVYVGFSGRLGGHAVLMLPAPDALSLARILVEGLGEGADHGLADEDAAGMTPLERSGFEELTNVAVAGVLGGLGDHLGEAIHPSVPVFVYDMAGAVLDGIVSNVVDADEMLFAARTMFSQDTRDATGVLLVMPAGRE